MHYLHAAVLMKAVKTKLTRMEKAGVLSQVTEPSDWCAGMVVVPKKNNTVRICADLTKLNKCVKRERHPLHASSRTSTGTVSRSFQIRC